MRADRRTRGRLLGDGAIRVRRRPPPGRFTAISTRSGHACALTETGEVVCWGEDPFSARFGEDDPPPGRFTAISVTSWRSCALTDAGELTCCAANPEPPGRFTAISTNFGSTCAVTEAGDVACWEEPERYWGE